VKTVGAYEAKTHLPKLLEQAARGEEITITRHGRPVAVLRPVCPETKPHPAKAIAALKEFRSQHRLGGLSLRRMIEEGRS
jgi:prevent-host-death family protein